MGFRQLLIEHMGEFVTTLKKVSVPFEKKRYNALYLGAILTGCSLFALDILDREYKRANSRTYASFPEKEATIIQKYDPNYDGFGL